MKKQDKLKISSYEKEHKRLEKEYWGNPNDACLARLVKAKFELNTIFTKKHGKDGNKNGRSQVTKLLNC